MKKTIYLVAVLTVAMTLMCNIQTAKAQANSNHVFHVITWYMVPGLDSTARAELGNLLKEQFTKVTSKNEYVLHEWNMRHFFSEDSREMVTIDEYANWESIEKAFTRDDELAKQAWPDAKQRADFNKKLGSYFTHHKDAIYNSLPGLNK